MHSKWSHSSAVDLQHVKCAQNQQMQCQQAEI